MDSVLYTDKDLAEKSGESQEKIKTLRRRGKLEYVLIPKGERQVVRYTQQALDHLLGERSANNYKALRDEWKRSLLAGTHPASQTPLKEKTVNDYLGFLKNYWDRLKIEESVQGISPDNFDKVMETLPVNEQERRDHHALKLKIYNVLASFYQHLIRRGFKNDLELIAFRKRRPKKKPFPPRRTVLRDGDLQKLLNANESLDGRSEFDRALMKTLILLYTCAGLRRNEALVLECDWINFETGQMEVLGKDNVWRTLRAGSILLEQLNDWYKHWRPKSRHKYFILQADGSPFKPNAVQTRLSRLRTRAKVNITTHGFRHTFATTAGDNGIAPARIKTLMGHKHLSTTDIYLQTDGAAAAADMVNIDFGLEDKPTPAKKKKQQRDIYD